MPIFGALTGFSFFLGSVTTPFAVAAAPHSAVITPELPSYQVTLTAYNAVPAQTDSSPLTTASGLYSNPSTILARSQDMKKELPFGTIVEIDASHTSSGKTCGYNVVAPLIGYRIVADSMNKRFHDRVDVLLSAKDSYVKPNGKRVNAATVLGRCSGVTIRVVGHVNLNDLAQIPRTQAELAAIVEQGHALAINK